MHIRLWGVSANLKQVCTGKEKFPSRAYELICNRRGMLLSATKGFYGTVVDTSIVKFDAAMNLFKDGLYTGEEGRISASQSMSSLATFMIAMKDTRIVT